MGLCKLMKRKLDTARSLSRRDWWTLGQAWVLLWLVDLALRLLPFRAVQKFVAQTRRRPKGQEAATTLTILDVQRLVNLAGQCHLYPMRCLPQALVMQWLLSRQGIHTELRIGVRKKAAKLSAHAWIERSGQPIGEAQGMATGFVPLVAPGAER